MTSEPAVKQLRMTLEKKGRMKNYGEGRQKKRERERVASGGEGVDTATSKNEGGAEGGNCRTGKEILDF